MRDDWKHSSDLKFRARTLVRERGIWHLDAVYGFVLTKNDLMQFNPHYDQD